MNKRPSTENVLKAHRFQLKSEMNSFLLGNIAYEQTWRNVEELFKELCWRICDDREGRNEVEQEHDLHNNSLPAIGHGEHNVVRNMVAKREVTGRCHRKVDQEQNLETQI